MYFKIAKELGDAKLNDLVGGAIEVNEKGAFNFLYELDLNAPFEFINFPAANFTLFDISISITTFFNFMLFSGFLLIAVLLNFKSGYNKNLNCF